MNQEAAVMVSLRWVSEVQLSLKLHQVSLAHTQDILGSSYYVIINNKETKWLLFF